MAPAQRPRCCSLCTATLNRWEHGGLRKTWSKGRRAHLVHRHTSLTHARRRMREGL